ncbi:unnamed protein product [Hydatigera taeniaeformis]|uniref:Peptide n=1 Tax=Hydatigena taeniaeformis TaxID=6205 RepID=A0A0R3XDN4_HYDTA|nr:unnamed protein product [Hydatigera taeniaeformis]
MLLRLSLIILLTLPTALEAAGENATEMDELEAYMDAIKRGEGVRGTTPFFFD